MLPQKIFCLVQSFSRATEVWLHSNTLTHCLYSIVPPQESKHSNTAVTVMEHMLKFQDKSLWVEVTAQCRDKASALRTDTSQSNGSKAFNLCLPAEDVYPERYFRTEP